MMTKRQERITRPKFTIREERDQDQRLVQGFAATPNVIAKNPHIKPGLKALYTLLQSYNWADSDGRRKDAVFTSQETLATHLCATSRCVRNYLYELQDLKLIEIFQDEDTGHNIYELKKITTNVLKHIEAKFEAGSCVEDDHRKNIPVPPEKYSGTHRKNIPPNKMKEKKDEVKDLAVAVSDTESDEEISDDVSSGRHTSPSPSPRPRAKRSDFKPVASGERKSSRQEEREERVAKADNKWKGPLPETYEEYCPAHWVRFFKKKMDAATGEPYVTNAAKDASVMKRFISDGVKPADLAARIEWFAENFEKLGVNNPGVGSLRGYWNQIVKKTSASLGKKRYEDDGWKGVTL